MNQMLQNTLQNTLFNRIISLKIKLNKFQTKQLGQVVKDKYLLIYNKLPQKITINLKSKTGDNITRLVSVYPNEFVPEIDKLITNYITRFSHVFKNSKLFKNTSTKKIRKT